MPNAMTQFTTNKGVSMLIVTNLKGKIIQAYSGPIAKLKWNELLNTVNLN